MKEKDNFSHSASVFNVSNIAESIAFYTNKLSFDLTFTWGDPIDYAILKKGGVSIHLNVIAQKEVNRNANSHIYIFVHDIHAIYDLCCNNDIKILNHPGPRDYKMTDFDISDLDNNIITFGHGK